MINRAKLQHIMEYAKQQRHIGLHCKVPPEDMVEIVGMAMLQGAGVTEKCRSSENVQEVQEYPETLPCPVFLEPALRFGKGVPTRTMLGALRRRSEYYSELEAMTPEQRAEHDAGMNEFAAMLQGADGNSPVIPDGWKLVPVEPTAEMIQSGISAHYERNQIQIHDRSAPGPMECAYVAMLAAAPHQGAEPVTTAYKLQDGWVACSERMPDGMQTVITSNGFDIGQGWWDGEGWNSFDSHDVVPGEVTHWMPLPAAPQQEVKP